MAKYTSYGLSLTEGQIRKISNACDKGREVTIRIPKKSLSGSNRLPLTQTQVNKVTKSASGVELRLSKAQVAHMKKDGGFLPLLLAAIPAIAAAAGTITSIVNSTKQTSEMARHNRATEDIARGSGMLSNLAEPIPLVGKALSDALKIMGLGNCCVKNLKGAAWGTGLYLEREGSGLFLARQGD